MSTDTFSDLDSRNQNSQIGPEAWPSRIIRKRFPIMMLLLLALWTFSGFFGDLEAILHNALLLDSYQQLAFLSLVNIVAVVFSFATLRLLNERIPEGNSGWLFKTPLLLWLFGDGAKRWGITQYIAANFIAFVSPVVLSRWFNSEFPHLSIPHWLAALIAIGIGVALGWLVFLAIAFMNRKMEQDHVRNRNIALKLSKGLLEKLFGDRSSEFEKRVKNLFFSQGDYFPFDFSTQVKPEYRRLHPAIKVLEVADLQLFIAVFTVLASHWAIARFFAASDVWLTSAPSMVIMMIWIIGMILAGIANLLDGLRLPIILILVVVIAGIKSLGLSTSVVRTIKDNSVQKFPELISEINKNEIKFLEEGPEAFDENDRPADRQDLIAQKTRPIDDAAWNGIKLRMENVTKTQLNQSKGKTLVVVTCPGGGIHAASWAACVLERISEEYVDFSQSVCVISAVSGGSVGVLYYVSKEFHEKLASEQSDWPPVELTTGITPPTGIAVGSALELATRSSLEDIAYGMTNDDLYGAFLPFLALRDRGQRLEDSFSRRLPESQRDMTLGEWGDLAATGVMPIVVFNATDAVTGRRILFDSIPTPRRPSNVGMTARPINYRELIDSMVMSRDIRPVTAVRTSATFPYVSPFIRPDSPSSFGSVVALGDGGYADNEGIVTAANWIEFILKRWSDEKSGSIEEEKPADFNRILLLRIQPSPTEDRSTTPKINAIFSSLRWALGPAETMINVRSASQAERGNLETDLASLFSNVDAGGSVDQMSGLKTSFDKLASRKRSTQKTYDAEYARRSTKKTDVQRAWKNQIENFKERLMENDDLNQFVPEPPSKNILLAKAEGDDEAILVEEVNFANYEQVIPLNWKLKRDQKLWYLHSWYVGSQFESSLRQTLDKYFTRRDSPE